MKIFGREPARWISIIGAVLAAFAAIENPWVNAGQAVAIVAVITAALVAYTTRPMTPALVMGVFTAGTALLAEYQVALNQQVVATIGAAIIYAVGTFNVRDQVDPQETVLSSS